MFGFGLKLKPKPKPTISTARRPRDQVGEKSQNTDAIGQNEKISLARNSKIEEPDSYERSKPTIVSNVVEALTHSESCHLEPKNINSENSEETSEKTDALNSPSVISLVNSISAINNDRASSHSFRDVNCAIENNSEENIPILTSTVKEDFSAIDGAIEETASLENSVILKDVNTVNSSSENVKLDSNRQKRVPITLNLLKKKKFVPKLCMNSDSIYNESDCTPVVATECESHIDSQDITSKTAMTLSDRPIYQTIGDENPTTSNEQLQGIDSPPAQPVQSLHLINSHKEPVSPSKPISDKTADKENSICSDDDTMHDPSTVLPFCWKMKPKETLKRTVSAKKELNKKLKDGVIDKSKLIMRDLSVYNPTSNPMSVSIDKNLVLDEISSEQSDDDIESTDDSDEESMPVPRLKVGPNGKVILDTSSLVIETTSIEKNRADLENSKIVNDNEVSGPKPPPKRRRNIWSPGETILFYKAVHDIGTDFTLMEPLFPGRTRKDLKCKFKREEKINLKLVDKAMAGEGDFDYEGLKEELTRDRTESARQKRMKEEHKLFLKNKRSEEMKQRRLNRQKEKELAKKRRKQNEIKRKKRLAALKSKDSCNDDLFLSPETGGKPKRRYRMSKKKEELETRKMRKLLETKTAAEIFKEEIEKNYFHIAVKEEQQRKQEQLESLISTPVSLDNGQGIGIYLFEDPPADDYLEESSNLQNEQIAKEQNNNNSCKGLSALNGSRLSKKESPENAKLVAVPTITSNPMVDVRGNLYTPMAMKDCKNRISHEMHSRKKSTKIYQSTAAETTNCQNFTIRYGENIDDIIIEPVSSNIRNIESRHHQMVDNNKKSPYQLFGNENSFAENFKPPYQKVTHEEMYSSYPYSEHSYCSLKYCDDNNNN